MHIITLIWTVTEQPPLLVTYKLTFCYKTSSQENHAGDNSANSVDPMRLVVNWRDKFPIRGLDASYIGDNFPLCEDLPQRAFLRKGAKYRFLGLDPKPQFHYDAYVTPDISLTIDEASSNLAGVLKATQPFLSEIVLTDNIACVGNECR